MNPTIRFQNVSKCYTLGGFRGNLREAIPNFFWGMLGRKTEREEQNLWALRDLTFQVMPGEALGIIGPNGAGKTTTLKLITNVTQPTGGEIVVSGRTSALIELGAGFHPDLTGRENIYLNGTILGMKRHEIDKRFDAIVDFSELERFLDTPVKRYSSGMYARLGFAVAAHVNPDVLITDEVLAVGDVAFQAKCLKRMAEMKEDGTTVIMVSHALPRLRRLCDRALLLYQGQKIIEGDVDEVIATYQNNPEYSSNLKAQAQSTARVANNNTPADSPSGARITKVSFLNGELEPAETFRPGESLVARIDYEAFERIESPVFEIWFDAADGTAFAAHTTAWDGYRCDHIEGKGHIDLIVDPLPMMPGRYTFSAAITAADGISRFDWHVKRYWFRVEGDQYAHGMVFLPHEWRLNNGHNPEGNIAATDPDASHHSARTTKSGLSS